MGRGAISLTLLSFLMVHPGYTHLFLASLFLSSYYWGVEVQGSVKGAQAQLSRCQLEIY